MSRVLAFGTTIRNLEKQTNSKLATDKQLSRAIIKGNYISAVPVGKELYEIEYAQRSRKFNLPFQVHNYCLVCILITVVIYTSVWADGSHVIQVQND